MKNYLFLLTLLFFGGTSFKSSKTITKDANMNFQFKFDTKQERLNNLGNPSTIPKGHAAQTPSFNSLSSFYIELVPTKYTKIREGAVIYLAEMQPSDDEDFDQAVTFDNAIVSDEGVDFLSLPIKDIPAGTYEYLRISVTYQNADIRFNLKNLPEPLPSSFDDQKGTFAGFIGFNTHISDFTVKEKTITVNNDKKQGYWAFEPQFDEPLKSYFLKYANPAGVYSGQAPQGATTVVNPLEKFGVKLPIGSCLVTGKLDNPLTITGKETKDIDVKLSFSVNKSFEWVDENKNGEWDFDFKSRQIEKVVDMGLRGLKVFVN